MAQEVAAALPAEGAQQTVSMRSWRPQRDTGSARRLPQTRLEVIALHRLGFLSVQEHSLPQRPCARTLPARAPASPRAARSA